MHHQKGRSTRQEELESVRNRYKTRSDDKRVGASSSFVAATGKKLRAHRPESFRFALARPCMIKRNKRVCCVCRLQRANAREKRMTTAAATATTTGNKGITTTRGCIDVRQCINRSKSGQRERERADQRNCWSDNGTGKSHQKSKAKELRENEETNKRETKNLEEI